MDRQKRMVDAFVNFTAASVAGLSLILIVIALAVRGFDAELVLQLCATAAALGLSLLPLITCCHFKVNAAFAVFFIFITLVAAIVSLCDYLKPNLFG
jgi:hypothetical protein